MQALPCLHPCAQLFSTITRLGLDWPVVVTGLQVRTCLAPPSSAARARTSRTKSTALPPTPQGVMRAATGAEALLTYNPSCLFPSAGPAQQARVQLLFSLIQPPITLLVVAALWALR